MPTCLTADELLAVAAGAAPSAAQAEHLRACETCQGTLRTALQATAPGEAATTGPAGDAPGGDLALAAVPVEPSGRYERVVDARGRLEVLGRGGYSKVVLGRDLLIGRDLALKTLRTRHLASPRRHLLEQRLLHEARVVGQLEHPAIVPLHDIARAADGRLYYAMRRIRGRTLSQAARSATSLEERLRLLPHVLAACHAVAYAHSRGVIHRDLKPQNVMVDRFGETLVIDWGLARTRTSTDTFDLHPETSGALRLVGSEETLSDGRGRVGTPAYMSPEQLTGVRALIDEKSDVWGLGGILFEVLAGRAPREHGPSQAPPPKVRAVVPELPEDLAALCDKALEESRERRYQSAEALALDLDAWLHGQRVTAHAYRPAELAQRFVRTNRVALLVAAAAVVVLLMAGGLAGLRVRTERNQARDFALLLAGDVLQRLPFDAKDSFRTELTARVSDWLRRSPVESDAENAAWAWRQLVSDLEVAGKADEARAAAERCLAVHSGDDGPVSPRLQAALLLCQVAAIDNRYEQPLPERYRQLAALWEARAPREPDSRELIAVYANFAQRLAWQSSYLAEPAVARGYAEASVAMARRYAEVEPGHLQAWLSLSYAQYYRMITAINDREPALALRLGAASVDTARRAHALGRSARTLEVLADGLAALRITQRFFPAAASEEVASATSAEARRLYEALLVLAPEAPVYRRSFAAFLLEEGELDAGWRLVAALPHDAELDTLKATLLLSVLVGQQQLVQGALAARLEQDGRHDSLTLLALAAERAGRLREAAAHARRAAQQPFISSWPVDTMPRWAATLTGPTAPALQALAAALSRAQRENDEAVAQGAWRSFADALDALAGAASTQAVEPR